MARIGLFFMVVCAQAILSTQTSWAAGPTASFTADITTGKGALTVRFTDTSGQGTAEITSWLWDFGDGTVDPLATFQNPVHYYEYPGTYAVSLTVTSSEGADSTIKEGLIVITDAPVFRVDVNKDNKIKLINCKSEDGNAGEREKEITFEDEGEGEGEGEIFIEGEGELLLEGEGEGEEEGEVVVEGEGEFEGEGEGEEEGEVLLEGEGLEEGEVEGEDGLSWSTAFNTIQKGIDAAYAAGGGEVWVAEGTYIATTEPIVILKENVHVFGGFIGIGEGETLRSQRDWNERNYNY